MTAGRIRGAGLLGAALVAIAVSAPARADTVTDWNVARDGGADHERAPGPDGLHDPPGDRPRRRLRRGELDRRPPRAVPGEGTGEALLLAGRSRRDRGLPRPRRVGAGAAGGPGAEVPGLAGRDPARPAPATAASPSARSPRRRCSRRARTTAASPRSRTGSRLPRRSPSRGRPGSGGRWDRRPRTTRPRGSRTSRRSWSTTRTGIARTGRTRSRAVATRASSTRSSGSAR